MANLMLHLSFFSISLNIIWLSCYSAKNSHRILILADVHLDLLYDSDAAINNPETNFCKNLVNETTPRLDPTDLGNLNCNTNRNLLLSTLNQMKQTNPNPNLIIFGGDSVTHHLLDHKELKDPKLIFRETITVLYNMIKEFFPNTTLLPVIGNNDLTTGYSALPPGNNEEYKFWYQLYNMKTFANKIDFHTGGFYSFTGLDDSITFIALNSLYFDLEGTKDEIGAYTQLFWLNRTLHRTPSNTKVMILAHIGPFPQFIANTTTHCWHQEYLSAFDEIIFPFRDRILLNLNFHKHYANFAVQHRPSVHENYLPTLILPSISPVRRNNPSFAELILENRTIYDVVTYILDLKSGSDKWQMGYSLIDDFGFKTFSAEEFFHLGKFLVFPWRLRRFATFRISYPKEDWSEALQKLKEIGNLDTSETLEHLRCNMVNFLKKEVEKCVVDYSEGRYEDF